MDGILKPLSVALTLMGLVALGSEEGGACYNPAVALGQFVFGISQTDGDSKDSQIYYFWIFLIAPIFSGIAAGLV